MKKERVPSLINAHLGKRRLHDDPFYVVRQSNATRTYQHRKHDAQMHTKEKQSSKKSNL